MINHSLLLKRTDYNEFTQALRTQCQERGSVVVTRRDGLAVDVIYQSEDPKQLSDEGFYAVDYTQAWSPNGQSVTSKDWDLIEFNEPREPKQDASVTESNTVKVWGALHKSTGGTLSVHVDYIVGFFGSACGVLICPHPGRGGERFLIDFAAHDDGEWFKARNHTMSPRYLAEYQACLAAAQQWITKSEGGEQ